MTAVEAALARARWATAVVREPRLRHQPVMYLGARAVVDLGPSAQLTVAPGFVAARDLYLVVLGRFEVGDRFFANRWCSIFAHEHVRIGSDVLLGERVSIHDEDHAVEPIGDAAIRRTTFRTAPIELGDRVWIGAGSMVLKGVTIGADTVVAANSVVTRSLPAGVVAAGAPARVVRELSSRDTAR